MERIPDDIRRHRLPGTEIKKIGNRYYIQRITSKRVPGCKWPKKILLEYIGTVTAEGIVPRKSKRVPAAAIPRTKEFGATWAVRALSGDILEALRRHFPDDAEWLYALAVLRCVNPSAMQYAELNFETSYLSELFPGAKLSSQQISRQMKLLGRSRAPMVAFMREFAKGDKWFQIVDGSALLCHSKNIADAQLGYNAHGARKPQINLLYALSITKTGREFAPVFFKRYPGSIRDVSAFSTFRKEMKASNALVIADKGFQKLATAEELEREGLGYIMPLRRTSREWSRAPLEKPGLSGFSGRFLYAGRIIWWWAQPFEKGSTHRYVLYLDESLRHAELAHDAKNVGGESGKELAAIQKKQLLCGTFAIRTNQMDLSAQTLYELYKLREDVEQLVDAYKVELGCATTGMHSDETLESCLFLNHLALAMAYRVYNELKKRGMLKKYAVTQTLEQILAKIMVTNVGDGWTLEPAPKACRNALSAMGLSLPDAPA